MKRVKLGKDYFVRENRRFFLVGTNYMPSKAFYRLWEDWNPKQIELDFRRMKELGIDAVRVPLFWASVEPEEGMISSTFLRRFDEFLKIAKKHGVYVMPFLFVGTCVDIWDVPWRRGRNLYKDTQMLKAEQEQARTLAERYAGDPALFAWDISDEPYYYGGNTDAETATSWVSSIYETMKSKDKMHPITLGFDNAHVIDNTGFQVERLVPFQDLFSFCAYPIYSLKTPETHTSMRSTYFTSFFAKFSQLGKPVLLSEGPGTTTVWTSLQKAADYYRVVMYSSFINGSIGVMPWILYDYDPDHHQRFPLDDKPFETSFGMLHNNGKEKLEARELSKFAKVIKKIDLDEFRFRKPEAALLIPKDYYKHVKMVWPRLFESFILAKEAHIELDFVREGQDVGHYKLVIIPSCLVLRTSSWYSLKNYVEHGGNLYFSYGGSWVGSPNPLGPFFNDVFGVELQDIVAPAPSEELAFTKEWMDLRGLRLAYPKTEGASCIEFEPEDAVVVGHSSGRKPAITVHRSQRGGSAVLVSKPVEHYLSLVPDVYVTDKTFRIYGALKRQAGISEQCVCDSPFIETGWMETRDKKEAILIMVNHERHKISTTVSLTNLHGLKPVLKGEADAFEKKAEKTRLKLSFAASEVKIFHATS